MGSFLHFVTNGGKKTIAQLLFSPTKDSMGVLLSPALRTVMGPLWLGGSKWGKEDDTLQNQTTQR